MNRLNDKIWNSDNKIVPIIREKLLALAKHVTKDIEPKIAIKHIYFTGSLATFSWNALSDIDLHIIVKILEPHEDDTLNTYFDLICKNFNMNHDIFIKGFKVEVNIKEEESFYKGKAIYDLVNDTWVKKPKKERLSLNDERVIESAKKYQLRIDDLIKRNGSIDEAKALKQEIKDLRVNGLQTEGEYSIGNLTFKKLRNTEYIAKLFDYWCKLEDSKYSLESFRDRFSSF